MRWLLALTFCCQIAPARAAGLTKDEMSGFVSVVVANRLCPLTADKELCWRLWRLLRPMTAASIAVFRLKLPKLKLSTARWSRGCVRAGAAIWMAALKQQG